MVRAYIVGNSHVRNMVRVQRKWPEKARGMQVYSMGDKEEPDWISSAKLIKLGRNCDVPLFLSRPGALHNHVSLFDPGGDYDVLTADDEERPASAIVPRRIFTEWIGEQHFSSGFLRRLKKAWGGRLHFLSIPPPKQSKAFLHDRLSRRSIAGQNVGGVKQIDLGRTGLRLKIWKLEQEVVREWAEANGVGFVSTPAKVFNDDGFLARRFYEDDMTHANLAYALEMLNHLDKVVRNLTGK